MSRGSRRSLVAGLCWAHPLCSPLFPAQKPASGVPARRPVRLPASGPGLPGGGGADQGMGIGPPPGSRPQSPSPRLPGTRRTRRGLGGGEPRAPGGLAGGRPEGRRCAAAADHVGVPEEIMMRVGWRCGHAVVFAERIRIEVSKDC